MSRVMLVVVVIITGRRRRNNKLDSWLFQISKCQGVQKALPRHHASYEVRSKKCSWDIFPKALVGVKTVLPFSILKLSRNTL
jgi:hypothetical protein